MGKEASKTKIRDSILKELIPFLEDKYDTYVKQVGSGEYTMMIPDEEGNKIYANIKVSIPRGTRNGEGGYTPYNGYQIAKDYKDETEAKVQERAVKKAMKEAEKGKKKTEGE